MTHTIILDCDPGQDDAIALFLALVSPVELQILGITTVAGNVPVDRCQRNARLLCEWAGRGDVPVYRGASQPLLRPLVTAEHVHGRDGLTGFPVADPAHPLQRQHAVDFLIQALMGAAEGEVTLVAMGPLTNLALAIRLEPGILSRIRELVIMGGAARGGNVTPVAEFNVYVDPHAAQIVFGCGRPITVMGLDVTHQTPLTEERIRRFGRAGRPLGRMVEQAMTEHRRLFQEWLGVDAASMHDACTVAYLLQPTLFTGSQAYVQVETDSRLTLGTTVVETRSSPGWQPNATWITRVDVEGFYGLITDRIGNHAG